MSRFFFTSKLLVLLLSALVVSGCSYLGFGEYFRDRSNDYRRSEEMPPMQVPEGLNPDAIGELYPIPSGGEVVSYEIEAEFEVPRPRSAAINESVNEVKIQRLGEDVWILMSVPPSEAWPRIRSYLTRNGIPTAKADASRGIIETGLFKLSDEPELFQQFRIALSQGVQVNTTEIEIIQRSFNENSVPDSLPEWAAVSVDVGREDWLRDTMSAELAGEEAYGTASLLGQEVGAASKVELVTPEQGYPYIEMRMVLGRAWASVGYALTKDGFIVVEEQYEGGYYLSDYQKPSAEEERSWWSRLNPFSSRGKEPVFSYRVDLVERDGAIHVRVENRDGSEMSQRDNFLVLEMIRNNLA